MKRSGIERDRDEGAGTLIELLIVVTACWSARRRLAGQRKLTLHRCHTHITRKSEQFQKGVWQSHWVAIRKNAP